MLIHESTLHTSNISHVIMQIGDLFNLNFKHWILLYTSQCKRDEAEVVVIETAATAVVMVVAIATTVVVQQAVKAGQLGLKWKKKCQKWVNSENLGQKWKIRTKGNLRQKWKIESEINLGQKWKIRCKVKNFVEKMN